jgi:hypothetical protein
MSAPPSSVTRPGAEVGLECLAPHALAGVEREDVDGEALVFGALISIEFQGEIAWTGWVFAVATIVVARPVALVVSFVRSRLWRSSTN